MGQLPVPEAPRHLRLPARHPAALGRIPGVATEAAEKLEQLRALENGFSIAVARVEHDSVGVDVPTDVARVEALLASTASVTHCA